MAGYPVIWKPPEEIATAGQLELGPSSLTLRGGDRHSERRIEVGYDEIASLGRTTERIGPLHALQLDGPTIGTILIAAFNVAALNSEILEQLQLALAKVS